MEIYVAAPHGKPRRECLRRADTVTAADLMKQDVPSLTGAAAALWSGP